MFSLRIRLPSIRIRRIRSPKTQPFENVTFVTFILILRCSDNWAIMAQKECECYKCLLSTA